LASSYSGYAIDCKNEWKNITLVKELGWPQTVDFARTGRIYQVQNPTPTKRPQAAGTGGTPKNRGRRFTVYSM